MSKESVYSKFANNYGASPIFKVSPFATAAKVSAIPSLFVFNATFSDSQDYLLKGSSY